MVVMACVCSNDSRTTGASNDAPAAASASGSRSGRTSDGQARRRPRRVVTGGGDVSMANVTIERRDLAPVVHVHGEVDFPNADEVRTQIATTLPIDGPGMIVDLTQT